MNKSKLFQLVRLGHNSILIPLLNDSYNDKNEYGQSILHEAIATRNIEISRHLIDLGANVDAQDEKGQTPLHYAASDNHNLDLVQLLIANGANVSIKDQYGNSPLWTAVFNARGEYSVVKVLVDQGVAVEDKNSAGRSPLDFAIQINDHELVNILKSYNV